MKIEESGLNIVNDYTTLDKSMFSVVDNNSFGDSILKVFNEELAKSLELNSVFFKEQQGINILSGSEAVKDNKPYAQAYCGHQFGHLSVLGDGRALMIGEHKLSNGEKYDLQLKGSGKTPYSRRGDGLATYYSMLREYIISEGMFYLNVPTTRSLAVVKTEEHVYREKIHDGSVMTRVAKSHIRVGTFVYTRVQDDIELTRQLADYTINRHFPEITQERNKYQKLLSSVVEKQAKLIAKWQSIGFIHGVMNTDNVLITGETIDYGPCAFMDTYDPETVFSSIDKDGRYAYKNQPFIGSWNMARFAETLLPLLNEDLQTSVELANESLSKYEKIFKQSYYLFMLLKIGISTYDEALIPLIDRLLVVLEKYKLDFTNFFVNLTNDNLTQNVAYYSDDFISWVKDWKDALLDKEITEHVMYLTMKKNNPVIIPRNHIVEDVLKQASEKDDLKPLIDFLELLKNPFDYSKQLDVKYTKPLIVEDYKTFCGT